jgi:hypothetical protein
MQSIVLRNSVARKRSPQNCWFVARSGLLEIARPTAGRGWPALVGSRIPSYFTFIDRAVRCEPTPHRLKSRFWHATAVASLAAIATTTVQLPAQTPVNWGPWEAIPDGQHNGTDIGIHVGKDGYGLKGEPAYNDHTIRFRFRNRYAEAVVIRVAITMATSEGSSTDYEEPTLDPGAVDEFGGMFAVGNHVTSVRMVRIQFGYPKPRAIFQDGRQICCNAESKTTVQPPELGNNNPEKTGPSNKPGITLHPTPENRNGGGGVRGDAEPSGDPNGKTRPGPERARTALNSYRNDVDRAIATYNASDQTDRALQAAVTEGRNNVSLFEARYASRKDASIAPALYAQLESDVRTAASLLLAAFDNYESARSKAAPSASSAPASRGGTSGAATEPGSQLSPDEIELLGYAAMVVFHGWTPSTFGTSQYAGALEVGWSHEAATTLGRSDSFPGQSVNGRYSHVWWNGTADTPTSPGFELGLGGGYDQLRFNEGATGNRPKMSMSEGDARLSLWLGFLGVGAMGRYENVHSTGYSTRGIANDGVSTRFLVGPVLSVANNNYSGLRFLAEGFYLSGTTNTRSSFQWASPTPSSSRVVKGAVGELGLGIYYLRAEARWQQMLVQPLNSSFTRTMLLGAGLRVPFL